MDRVVQVCRGGQHQRHPGAEEEQPPRVTVEGGFDSWHESEVSLTLLPAPNPLVPTGDAPAGTQETPWQSS
ncbi:hypothetical protein GCM10009657_20920 [Oryzihumus leptocrescens]